MEIFEVGAAGSCRIYFVQTRAVDVSHRRLLAGGRAVCKSLPAQSHSQLGLQPCVCKASTQGGNTGQVRQVGRPDEEGNVPEEQEVSTLGANNVEVKRELPTPSRSRDNCTRLGVCV